MLSCGWAPPTGATAPVAIGMVGGLLPYRLTAVTASTLPDGPAAAWAAADEAIGAWVCAGIWSLVSVTCSLPPRSPMTRLLRPGPVPWCSGTRPLKSGSAKVFCPSPP